MLIELKNINKTYFTKTGVTFRALSNVTTDFDDTGLVFVLGKSGSGKSTLLNILGALDGYDSGEMRVGGQLTKYMKGNKLDYYRNTMVGFIFQEFNLIDSLSVVDNVKFALDIKGEKKNDGVTSRQRAIDMLDAVGLADKAKAKARNLSGGQRQRVAIARALVKDPKIVLADEPTGSLDSATGEEIIGILREISKTKLVIVVTHDAETSLKYGDRIIEMKDGSIYRDVRKRREGESLMASGVDIISNTLVRLDKDAMIDDHFTDEVNSIIFDSGRKTYLNVDSDENRMKALFPNLRDAINISSTNDSDKSDTEDEKKDEEFYKTDQMLSASDFVPYKGSDTPPVTAEFKKSKMSPWATLKMGFHNIGLKKFRLALIIIVTFIAFTLFGAANTLSTVSASRSLARSIQHDNVKTVSVSRNALYKGDGSDVIYDNVIESLEKKHAKHSFYKQYFSDMAVLYYRASLAEKNDYYFAGFVGITEIEDITDLGFNVLYGTAVPTGERDVVISQYAAEALVYGEIFGKDSNKTTADLIGKTIMVGGYDVNIKGIYESDYKRYKDLNNRTGVDGFNHVFQLFAGQDSGFVDAYREAERLGKNGYFNLNIDGEGKSLLKSDKIIVADKSNSTLNYVEGDIANSGIILPPSIAGKKEMLLIVGNGANALSDINAFNASENAFINIGKKSNFNFSTQDNNYVYGDYDDGSSVSENDKVSDIVITLSAKNYYIAGYVESTSYRGIMLDDDTLGAYTSNLSRCRQLMISLSPVERDNYLLIQDLLNNNMQINADFSFLFTIFLGVLINFEDFVIVASAILCVLTVLLMFNFVSTSIRLTKRSIGLLRALGVKKFNTFLVYVMEGLLVGAITFAISFTSLMIAYPIINASLSVRLAVHMPLMVMNPIVAFSMAGLSFGISILATMFPWFKFTKITPIEAISNRT